MVEIVESLTNYYEYRKTKYVRVEEVLIPKVPWNEHRKNHIEKVA